MSIFSYNLKMNQVSDNVSKALKELLPLSVINEIACFVFYDDHPRDVKTIDITVCSKSGVVQEFFQRELINSIALENVTNVSEIKILRNSKCELFYLVAANNIFIIKSKKEKLEVHQRIDNIHSYELEDLECRGQACLKVVLKDDAVPLVFDDNFDKLEERAIINDNITSDESLPIINQLMRKLNEAKYTTKCNENTLKEYLNLRQMATFSMYQKTQVNLENSVFKLSLTEISNALRIRTQVPIVKMCNKKIVIISSIFNIDTIPITDISVLLHGSTKQSLTYTTKLFEKISRSSYWKETNSQIDSNKESTIVAVVNIKEIKDNSTSRIDFDVVISYTKQGKNYLLPLESVGISALDTMGKNFDILSDEEIDKNILMLAILATSERIDLCLRHIRNLEDDIATSDIFCRYLKMETLGMNNVAIHKISPHHILHGLTIIFQDNINDSDHIMNVQVYSRSYSQVLALIHYMYDAIPYTIIATTQDCKLTVFNKDLSEYNDKHEVNDTYLNYAHCGSSMLKQSKMIKEYFDNCMIKMSESKDQEVINKVAFEINLLAQGLPKYLDFRNQVLEESLNGIKIF